VASKRDYYKVLGVPRTATDKEIKAAYRKLARQYHPDVNKSDPQAEDKFKEVAEAFAILSDKEKRATYDRGGHDAFGSGFDPFAGARPQDFDFGFGDVDLSELFRMFAGFGGGGPRAAQRPRRGGDLRVEVRVPFMDAVLGRTVEIEIPRHVACEDCSGTGLAPGARESACPDCHGSGRTDQRRGALRVSMTCPRCGGAGRLQGEPCGRCGGRGIGRGSERVRVRIPAGIEDGNTLRLAGKGDAGAQGAPAGDALLTIRLEPDARYRREGDDLLCDVPIGLVTAALGGKVEVPTPHGETTIQVAAGTRSGQKLRLRGRGIHFRDGREGDLLAVIQIHPPKRLDKRSKELLREFEKLNPQP